jgi:hypothetical protein
MSANQATTALQRKAAAENEAAIATEKHAVASKNAAGAMGTERAAGVGTPAGGLGGSGAMAMASNIGMAVMIGKMADDFAKSLTTKPALERAGLKESGWEKWAPGILGTGVSQIRVSVTGYQELFKELKEGKGLWTALKGADEKVRHGARNEAADTRAKEWKTLDKAAEEFGGMQALVREIKEYNKTHVDKRGTDYESMKIYIAQKQGERDTKGPEITAGQLTPKEQLAKIEAGNATIRAANAKERQDAELSLRRQYQMQTLIGDIVAAALLPGYSYVNQSVSELSAIGASTRPVTAAFGFAFEFFVLAFAVGVWLVADRRGLKVASVILGVFAVTQIPLAVTEGLLTVVVFSALARFDASVLAGLGLRLAKEES